ncbi:hypothetical protein H1C71_022173, partial [Ictidomys tridecemlineatus]
HQITGPPRDRRAEEITLIGIREAQRPGREFGYLPVRDNGLKKDVGHLLNPREQMQSTQESWQLSGGKVLWTFLENGKVLWVFGNVHFFLPLEVLTYNLKALCFSLRIAMKFPNRPALQ